MTFLVAICLSTTTSAFSGNQDVSTMKRLIFQQQSNSRSKEVMLALRGKPLKMQETDALSEDDSAETSDIVVADAKAVAGTIFLGGLGLTSLAAKSGMLRGPLDISTGQFEVYTDAMLAQDIGMSLATAILGLVLVKVIGLGYEKKLYDSKVSRKLSHTLSAPLFMIFFPFFSGDGSRFFAALVILANIVRLYMAGTGLDPKLANSVSRSGDKSEALGGPFIYVCLFQLFTLLFWRSSPIGVVAISTMAAGDGMADLVGRRFGRTNKWWFSEDKSIAGSVAFTISSALTSYGILEFFMYTGVYQSALVGMDLFLRVSAISLVCAAIELLPIGDDNYNVPFGAAILAAFLLQ